MNRFYVEKANIGQGVVRISDADDVHHLTRVLRVKTGEDVFVSDGDGAGYIAVLKKTGKSEAILKIKETCPVKRREDRLFQITLACAVPKYAQFEDIVDKATQLEVDEIIPLFTERTFGNMDIFKKKQERLKRIVVAAAKQSGVLFLPRLSEPVYFYDLMSQVHRFDLCILPNLSSQSLPLKEAVRRIKTGKILVMIGPEGDFSEREIKEAVHLGSLGVNLGDSVLRVDTAAIAVISYLRLY